MGPTLGGAIIWSSAVVPHGFRSFFEITWDCSRNVLIASSLQCHSFNFSTSNQVMPANACTHPPRRTPHPRQYLTQPHLLWSVSRSRGCLPRQPNSYFRAPFPYEIFFIRDSVVSSHNLIYNAIRFLISGMVIEGVRLLDMVSHTRHA